jgi:exoribonuclease II
VARIVEYMSGDQLRAALVEGEEKKKLQLLEATGRKARLPPDKVLFEHTADSIEGLVAQREALTAEVDVELLWESALEDAPSQDLTAADLARTYFDDTSPLHCSAVFQSLITERAHFRRRGSSFQPRSPSDLEQVRKQNAAKQLRKAEEEALTLGLTTSPLDPEICLRLERWLRSPDDKVLATVLTPLAKDPVLHAFELLLNAGHLSPTADLPLVQANLRADHPAAVLAYAEELCALEDDVKSTGAGFSIDDAETREVDDVLTITREGDELRVDIDIADVAAYVKSGDPVDREAQRRASTAYMPTGMYYMLPERVSCDLASLHVGEPRPAMRTSVWFNRDGQLQRHNLSRVTICVDERLDYDTADDLLGSGEGTTAESLRLLDSVAGHCRAARREAGAISFQRPEWKIRVSPDDGELHITPIPAKSPSRHLVAEMMILANRLAAERAAEVGLPMIYRVQPSPTGDVPKVEPDDPAAFAKLRGLLQPASLSLEPKWHWGLGVRSYTQVSSPLRRFSDLVAQRQLTAMLDDAPPPYDAKELLKVLAHAEAVERELKRTESLVNERWALEAVARLDQHTGLPGEVVSEVAGGYKVMLLVSGAVGLLTTTSKLELGDAVTVDVQRVQPRLGRMRLLLGS